MNMHIIQSPGMHSRNSLFNKHHQGHLGIFRNIINAFSATSTGAHTTPASVEGEASLALFENQKIVLIFGRKALIVSILWLNFPFKM